MISQGILNIFINIFVKVFIATLFICYNMQTKIAVIVKYFNRNISVLLCNI